MQELTTYKTVFHSPLKPLKREETTGSKILTKLLLVQSVAGIAIGILAITHVGPFAAIGTLPGILISSVELPIGLVALITKRVKVRLQKKDGITYVHDTLPSKKCKELPCVLSAIREMEPHFKIDEFILMAKLKQFNPVGITPFYNKDALGLFCSLEIQYELLDQNNLVAQNTTRKPFVFFTLAEAIQCNARIDITGRGNKFTYYDEEFSYGGHILQQFKKEPIEDLSASDLQQLISIEDQDNVPTRYRLSPTWFILRLLYTGSITIRDVPPGTACSFDSPASGKWKMKVLKNVQN